ncbi:MAG TPA: hypothetical protein VGR96_16710 [Acidobacteriaceae bacterium]|nr:hypothetical protein [Acidobacteriaceae bacterium]
MLVHLLEAFAGVSSVVLVSLLIGLLRSAKASSQVTEERQEQSQPPEDETGEGWHKVSNWASFASAS